MSDKSVWADDVGGEGAGGAITGETIGGKRYLHVALASGASAPGSTTVNISITPRGAYDASITYNVGDLVVFIGRTYIALTQTVGNVPTSLTHWQLILQGLGETYEAVSKNLQSWDAFYDYETELPRNLLTVFYREGGLSTGRSILKTFSYGPNGAVRSIILSGDTPTGISISKQLTYDRTGFLQRVTYR